MPRTVSGQELIDPFYADEANRTKQVQAYTYEPIKLVMSLTMGSQLLMLVLHAVMGGLSESSAKSAMPCARLFHVSSASLYVLFAGGTCVKIMQSLTSKRAIEKIGEQRLIGLGSMSYLTSVAAAYHQLVTQADALSTSTNQYLMTYGTMLVGVACLLMPVISELRRSQSIGDKQTFSGMAAMHVALGMFAAAKLWQQGSELGMVSAVVSGVAAVVYTAGLSLLMPCCAPEEEVAAQKGNVSRRLAR